MDYAVKPAQRPVEGLRPVPPSKSLHQRALVLAHLADGPTRLVAEGEVGEDVRDLSRALDAMGTWSPEGALGDSRASLRVHLGLGATGFRFALAAATLRPDGARTLVTGRAPLLGRPHGPLARALARRGARLKRRRSGAYRVHGGGLRPGPVDVAADVSSQFASALLLVAPRVGGLELVFHGAIVSRPYLDLTLSVLDAFGIQAQAEGLDGEHGRIRVPAGTPKASRYQVESDASSAAPWWAAAVLTGGTVRVPGLAPGSRQADMRLLDVLPRMGASVRFFDDVVEVGAPGGRLEAAGDVDLGAAPDLLPIVGVLAAGADGETRIHGAGHARFKESDRLATVAAGIRALGGDAEVLDGVGLRIRGGPLRGGAVAVAGDHRIALAFGVLGLVVEGVVLRGAEAVGKSYPSFLREMEAATAASTGA